MNEAEFTALYLKEKPVFEAWGSYISQVIQDHITASGFKIDLFLKVPVQPRLKEVKSLVAKAFYRGKTYKDPYNDITDKVGMRFVVLLVEEIKIIKDIIESVEEWDCSEDVDFIKIRENSPELFTYQSVHYIIRNLTDIEYSGVKIPADTPCEVQIRTLLQHAYAELTHDRVYKSDKTIASQVKRKVARSMALIEATDELFMEVQYMLNAEDMLFKDFISASRRFVNTIDYEEKTNRFIFDSYKGFVKENGIRPEQVVDFVEEKNYLIEKAKSGAEYNLIYKQPILFVLYYLIAKYRNSSKELWPLNEKDLVPIYTDLGLSLDA